MKNEIANTMISNRFEVYHVKDVITPEQTAYHSHDYYEIHCTLSGSGTFFLDGQEISLIPGSILLIQRNNLHRILKQTSEMFDRVYIFVTPKYLELKSSNQTNLAACFQNSSLAKNRLLRLPPKELQNLLAPLDQQPNRDYGADFFYEEKFLHLMIILNQLIQAQEHPLLTPLARTQSSIISEILQYIDEHLTQDLRQETISQHFYINKFSLSRKFKMATGLTLHQYILKKRLLLGKQLLRETESAGLVYLQVGFTSYPHFLRAFKTEFGMTTKEFLSKEHAGQFVRFTHEQ